MNMRNYYTEKFKYEKVKKNYFIHTESQNHFLLQFFFK